MSQQTTIYCTEQIRRLWPRPLAQRWAQEYPQLFDSDDIRLAVRQPRNHFAEWFAAIHLFQRDGVRSLLEKYTFQNHPRKVKMFEGLVAVARREALRTIGKTYQVQPPDLLLYRPDGAFVGFAEVKGPGDRLSHKQVRSHERICESLGVPVQVLIVRVVGSAASIQSARPAVRGR